MRQRSAGPPQSELELICEAAARRQPMFGVRRGAQLIAKAFGGRVYASAVREPGWLCVQSTEAAASDPICRYLERTTEVFQLHEDTFDLPTCAARLAEPAACVNQAFRVGETIYGAQFYPEMTAEMAEEWRGVLGLPGWRPPAGAYRRLAATCETLVNGRKGLR